MGEIIEEQAARDRDGISLAEHRAVIREIHHRLKNHLQVIVSLFSLQADRTTEPKVIDMLGEMQNRVRAITHVYEPLYSVGDFSSIHFGEYLNSFIRELETFFNLGSRVHLQVSLADLALDIERAVPLALITNELLSNAFKHAFPDERSGSISVTLRYAGNGMQKRESPFGELRIVDDGVGLPQGVDVSTADSMGLHVVAILTQQLEGTIEVQSRGGTSMRVLFPLPKEEV